MIHGAGGFVDHAAGTYVLFFPAAVTMIIVLGTVLPYAVYCVCHWRKGTKLSHSLKIHTNTAKPSGG